MPRETFIICLIVRAKSEVLFSITGTDSGYYNLLEDHSWGVKT